MEQFLMGVIATGCWVAGVFFLRFWRRTGDRLFLIFSASFILLGLTRLGLAMTAGGSESHSYFYWARLAAFLLIVGAIIDKNRPSQSH